MNKPQKLLRQNDEYRDTLNRMDGILSSKLSAEDSDYILDKVCEKYTEPHRFYHDFSHIHDLWQTGMRNNMFANKFLFTVVTLYHDIVYDPGFVDNENHSAEELKEDLLGTGAQYTNKAFKNDVETAKQTILDTAKRDKSECVNAFSRTFWDLDNSVLYSKDVDRVIEYEDNIAKEFQHIPYEEYKKERLNFLRENDASDLLVDYVESRTLDIGICPGTFNPIHIGHKNVLQRAKEIFDKIIVLVGYNPEKGEPNHVEDVDNKLNFFHVDKFEGMLHNYAKDLKSKNYVNDVTIVKGLRDGDDFNEAKKKERFSQELADWSLNKIPDVDFMYINTHPDYWHISSSSIRELEKIDNDSVKNYKV